MQLAEDMHSRYFHLPDAVWDKLTPDERWDANQRFLDRAIAREEPFILGINTDKILDPKEQKWPTLRREIKYLLEHKYSISGDKRRMFPQGNR